MAANLKAWLHLFDLWQPDLIFVDHSPTALLAAGVEGVPRAATGFGFILPPLSSPMPSLQPWFPIPRNILLTREEEFLGSINGVLKTLGGTPLDTPARLFEGVRTFLTTFPELDHYGPRPDVRYWGPVFSTERENGPVPRESVGDGAFVYLDYRYRFIREVFEQFGKLDLPVLAYVRDMPEEAARTLGAGNIHFASGPIDLERAVRECRFTITHGGVNTGSFALLSGKPLLILPEQLEQSLWAYRITEQKLGTAISWFNREPDFEAAIASLMHSGPIAGKVSSLARRYAGYDSGDTVRSICRLLL